MSDPEPDAIFRQRIIRLVDDELRPFVSIATGSELDAIGSKYDRFRTGVPLKGLGAEGSHSKSEAIRHLAEEFLKAKRS